MNINPKPTTVNVFLRADESEVAEWKKQARREYRSLSSLIRITMTGYVLARQIEEEGKAKTKLVP